MKHFCESSTKPVDNPALSCYFSLDKPIFTAVSGKLQTTAGAAFLRQERLIYMTNSYKRICSVLLSLLMLCMMALGASAAASRSVGVKFWKEKSEKESMANTGIDDSREATVTRQSNGTYTLSLPIRQVSKMGVTGYLTGLTIGDVTYSGTVSGDVTKGTAVLTIKNLPSSILTGSDTNKALTVTCNIQMDLSVLGEINTTARMCVWNK